jgi:hypothetical protein
MVFKFVTAREIKFEVSSEMNTATTQSHQLFIDFKKAYDSVRREVLCNILIEFYIPMKLVRLIKMCLTEMYSTVRLGEVCLTCFLLKMV